MQGLDCQIDGATDKIITFGKLLYRRGLVSGSDGNISVRLDSDRIVLTASGVHKGFMDASDLLVVNKDGSKILGTSVPSSEMPMHLAIYKDIKEAKAIIHAHAPWSTAASLRKDSVNLSQLAEGKLLFPMVEIVPFYTPGSQELAQVAAEAAKRTKIFILKAHGVVAWGGDLMEAFCLIEQLENNMKIIALSAFF